MLHGDPSALEVLRALAARHGLEVRGGRVRRTSSRFCLGVEHGDYNGTELFGVGTDRFLWLAARPNESGRVRLVSSSFEAEGCLDLDPARIPQPGSQTGWARYAWGALATLAAAGQPIQQGMDIAIHSNIPGGGMSRSASLCINLVLTLGEQNGVASPPDARTVRLAQSIENDYVGSPCGNLDQTMIVFAKAGHGTHFRPSTGEIEHIPLGPSAPDFRLLALDTGTVRPGLEQATYPIRRAECEQLVALARAEGFGIARLADVRTEELFQVIRARLGPAHPELIDRLRYLYEAQGRFESLLEAWRMGDVAQVGAIFRDDGQGLRDLYRVSGPELEAMCDIVREIPGVFGERMLGGGDKGASGAVVRAAAVPAVRAAIDAEFPARFPGLADRYAVHELSIVDGVTVLDAPL
ncbi:MAG: galactokinase [Planctomycetota bacterium]